MIPQPTDDPNDPLNWPKWRKAVAFSSVLVFATLSNWVIAGIGFAIPELLELFQHDLNSTAQGLIGSCILTLGVGVNRSTPEQRKLTGPLTELLLGSNCPLFRKTTGLPLRVAHIFCFNNLVRKSNFVRKFGGCSCNLCICGVHHRRSCGRPQRGSVFPS